MRVYMTRGDKKESAQTPPAISNDLARPWKNDTHWPDCRMALLDRKKRTEADRVARLVEHVELTLMDDYQENLVDAIHIPHMTDEFPHLKK
jgi:hypothetical protein